VKLVTHLHFVPKLRTHVAHLALNINLCKGYTGAAEKWAIIKQYIQTLFG